MTSISDDQRLKTNHPEEDPTSTTHTLQNGCESEETTTIEEV
jgi:hypothetical protein